LAHIVILGAGIGGMPMAYELKALLGVDDRITVVSNTSTFHFVPSNPWVAVNWRTRDAIEFEVEPYLARKGIAFDGAGAKRLHPERNQVELGDGRVLDYDFLVIATGPKLAFDEVEGLGPNGYTQSVCHVDHAITACAAWDTFTAAPGPVVVGAAQGASCFGPAYKFAFIMDTDLRKRKIRDRVPMTYVTTEPYIGHLGLSGVGDSKSMLESAMRERHIKWICNAKILKVEDGNRPQYSRAIAGPRAKREGDLERNLPGRLWRQRYRFCGPAENSAAQCQLVCRRQMGASGKDSL
jgi:sulfide:quinone oxidoreductase